MVNEYSFVGTGVRDCPLAVNFAKLNVTDSRGSEAATTVVNDSLNGYQSRGETEPQ